MTIVTRTSYKIELENPDGEIETVDLTAAESATVSDVIAAWMTSKSTPDTTTAPQNLAALVDRNLQAHYPNDALIAQCQLRHGQRLAVVHHAEHLPTAPVLAEVDRARFIHESGEQVGLAWSIRAGDDLRLAVDTARRRLLPGADETDLLVRIINEDDDAGDFFQITVINDSLEVLIDGLPMTSQIAAGSLVQILHHRFTVAEARILGTSDHEAIREHGGIVTFRVPTDPSTLGEVVPTNRELTPPVPHELPKWSWTDTLLREGGIAVLFVLMIARSGSLLYAAFLVIPVASIWWRRKEHHRKTAEIDEENEARLAAFNHEAGLLEVQVNREVAAIVERNPELSELANSVNARGNLVWQRKAGQFAFLKVSVGHGPYISPSTLRITGYETDAALMPWRANAERSRARANVPAEFDLKSEHLAFVGNGEAVNGLVNATLLRLMLQQGPASLTIAALLPTGRRTRSDLRWLRWFQHVSAPSPVFAGPRLVVGTNACQSAVEATVDLLREVDTSTNHLVLVAHEACGVSVGALEKLCEAGRGRVHIIWFGASANQVPSFLGDHIEVGQVRPDSEAEGRVQPHGRELSLILVAPEKANRLAARMAALVDESHSANGRAEIPTVVPLSDIVSVPEDPTEWQSAASHLYVTIGMTAEGPLVLDLTEDGPHMLLTGTSGSGKSEAERTLLLSAVSRYKPTEVGALMIDFKGGASLRDLHEVPHSIGLVSNLDVTDIDRVVAFLNEEVRRRQRILCVPPYNGEYPVYRLQHDDLPRLLVMIDELGGFMQDGKQNRLDAILNVAARGRSLGVHLVMATQSPKGVVNGALRANVNGRITLRTLDEDESVAVIDTKDAAHIPGALKGRGIVRLDTGRQLFQSGWSQSPYDPDRGGRDDSVIIRPFDPLHAADVGIVGSDMNAGGPVRPRFGTDAEAVIAALKGLERPDVQSQPRLLDSLLSIPQIPVPGTSADLSPHAVHLGIHDAPELQSQPTFLVDFALGGLLIQGPTHSGRTCTLRTIAFEFSVKPVPPQLVVIDGTGKGGHGLPGWQINGSDHGAIQLLLTQLAQRYDGGADHRATLVLIDRIDLLDPELLAAGQLSRLVASTGTEGVLFAATCDTNLAIDTDLKRAFRVKLIIRNDKPGLATSEDDALIQIFNPPETISAQPFAATPSRRYPVLRLLDRWVPRPVGLPGEPAGGLFAAYGPGVAIGVDAVRHEVISLRTTPSMAVVGDTGSGRTSTLLAIGEQIAQRQAARGLPCRVPFVGVHTLAPECRPEWMVDVIEEITEFCKVRSNELGIRVGTQGVLAGWESLGEIAPVLLADDLDQFVGVHERIVELADVAQVAPESIRSVLIDRLESWSSERGRGLVGAIEMSSFVDARMMPIARDRLKLRQVQSAIVLRPPLPILLPADADLLVSAQQRLITNATGRNYVSGEGAAISRGTRREIRVYVSQGSLKVASQFERLEEGEVL